VRVTSLRLLVLLALLLVGGLAWLWVDEHGQLRNVTWAAPAPVYPDLSAGKAPPPDAAAANPATFLAILERPVFAPDRRPPPPPAPPPPPDPMADIHILGIFSGETPGILARVEGKVRRVKLNESIGAWTLKSINGREVSFGQGEETRSLRLVYARIDTVNAAPPSGGAPAAGGPPSISSAPAAAAPNPQDAARETLRRRNEIRAARGLPLITE
jgi:hypothetical protein